jgi:hypothetical protein
MSLPLSANQVLDRYFLEMRCKVLDVAAVLDRINRAGDAGGNIQNDPRLKGLRDAVSVLLEKEPQRTERIQMIFSDAYEPGWSHPKPGPR